MKRKPLSPARLRAAEHKAYLQTLKSMQRANLALTRAVTKQADVMAAFMKSFEVASPPEARVMSDEREWLMEQEDHQALAKEVAQLTPLPNPFFLQGDD